MNQQDKSFSATRTVSISILPVPKRRPNRIESANDLLIFVVQSRRHIGNDEWTQVQFWQPTSLVKYMKKFNWSGTKTSETRVPWKDKQHYQGGGGMVVWW